MGCATSKQPVCRKCQALPCSPIRRSYSTPAQSHHPPHQEGESYHFVALSSTTLGSLELDYVNPNHHNNEKEEEEEEEGDRDRASMKNDDEKRIKELSMGLVEAKTWSKMINEKIPKMVPKTPTTTPPGEPEMINAWELMEGLEDTSPLRPVHHHLRSFSFHPNSIPPPCDLPISKPREDGESSARPIWVEKVDRESSSISISNSTSAISEFDPNVISTFRKALEELPPANPFHLTPLDSEKQPAVAGGVRPLEVGKKRVVLYFTSLRCVRKTYEDCCQIRAILKGLGIRVDERDVSMHSEFKEELKELLGDGLSSGNGGGLPLVFVGKEYVGGAEEIQRMHEEGKLEKLLECCEMVDGGGGGGGGGDCEACGDARFVPCEKCSGSCKIYCEGDCEEECEESDYGFRRCPDCNENGIVRCPICCD